MESLFEYRQRQNDWIDVNAVFIDSVDEPIEEKLLLKALSRVSKRHPTLRAKVGLTTPEDGCDGEGLEYLTLEDDPEFILNVETVDRSDWLQVVHEELKVGFGDKSPKWRAKILNGERVLVEDIDETKTDAALASAAPAAAAAEPSVVFKNVLVFSFHHAMVDGQSIMRFYDHLLDELCLCSAAASSFNEAFSSAAAFSFKEPSSYTTASSSNESLLPEVVSLPMAPSDVDALPPSYYYFNPIKKFLAFCFMRILFLLFTSFPQVESTFMRTVFSSDLFDLFIYLSYVNCRYKFFTKNEDHI